MQDYKLIVRNLTGGNTVLDAPNGDPIAQNFAEFLDYIHVMYLSLGYAIKEVHFLGKTPAVPETGQGVTYEFAYHLVKDLAGASEVESEPEVEPKGKSKG